MKPAYHTLKSNYNSSDYLNSSYLSAEDQYDEIGYDKNQRLNILLENQRLWRRTYRPD